LKILSEVVFFFQTPLTSSLYITSPPKVATFGVSLFTFSHSFCGMESEKARRRRLTTIGVRHHLWWQPSVVAMRGV